MVASWHFVNELLKILMYIFQKIKNWKFDKIIEKGEITENVGSVRSYRKTGIIIENLKLLLNNTTRS